jgi:16S rRNA (guanine527-N7)-methyltransferase
VYAALVAVLDEARRRGFLGPGPIAGHIARALDLTAAADQSPGRALDLGSGGGLPGLPLALAWPSSRWFLLDGSQTRATFLQEMVERLGLTDRATVVGDRAEVAARTQLRQSFDLAVARSFAAPAPTAECGAPFLRVGGHLVVAEPPGGAPERWDEAGLAKLGLRLGRSGTGPTAYQVLEQFEPCPDRYPRRVGVPAKRPLF